MDRLSYLTLQLVRVCKMYQRKAMARDTVLGALLSDAPEVLATLTQNRITEMINLADAGASQIVDREFAELEAVLLDSTDFQPALERYLDRNL